MQKEIWVDVINYEGYYQVSNRGEFRSIDRKIYHPSNGGYFIKGIKIKPDIMKNGYVRYSLYKDGNSERFLIHRIVASHFIPNHHNKPCVNHKDGNSKNNNIDNLEWCTYLENERHSYNVLGKKSHRKGKRYSESSYHREVFKFSLSGEYIRKYSCATEVSDTLGIDSSAIAKVCRGKRNKAGGFIWKYNQ